MVNAEFVKTSLHNHFGGSEADRTEYDSKLLFDLESAKSGIDLLVKANYLLLGMTNKNAFDYSSYIELRKHANSKSAELIPGVELCLVDDINKPLVDRKVLHVVVLFDPNSKHISEISDRISSSILTNKFNAVTIEQLVKIIFENRSILIPHGGKQKKRSSANNPDQLVEIMSLKDAIPIIFEDNTQAQRQIWLSKIASLLSEENYNWILNTNYISTIDRTPIEEVKEPTFLWGTCDFNSIFYAVIMSSHRFFRELDIYEKPRYISKISIRNQGGSLQKCDLDCSHGLNTIIGASGSGKTLLLNLLSKKLRNKNLEYAVSSTESNYDALYLNSEITLIDNYGVEVNPHEINVFEGENLYKQIITTYLSDRDKLFKILNATPKRNKYDDILQKFNTEIHDYVSNRKMKYQNLVTIDASCDILYGAEQFILSNISDQIAIDYGIDSSLSTIKDKLELEKQKVISDKKDFETSFATVKMLLTRYSVDIPLADLEKIELKFRQNSTIALKEIENKLLVNLNKLSIQTQIFSLVNKYNRQLGEKIGKIQHEKQNVSDNVEIILNTLKNISTLDLSEIIPHMIKSQFEECLVVDNPKVGIRNIRVNDKVTYEDTLSKYFSSSVGSGSGKILKSEFRQYKDKEFSVFSTEDMCNLLQPYIDSEQEMLTYFSPNISEFITYDIVLKTLEGTFQDITTLSAGQLSKIYVTNLIDEKLMQAGSNPIILYDQPDSNLEKDFILRYLGKKLSELKKSYQIFLTTHEPLLVVNSDSNRIIRAKNEKMVNKSNCISFENLGLTMVSSKDDMVETISTLIDGSYDAIKLRNQIYGGMKK